MNQIRLMELNIIIFSENQSNASAEAFTDFLMHQLQKER